MFKTFKLQNSNDGITFHWFQISKNNFTYRDES